MQNLQKQNEEQNSTSNGIAAIPKRVAILGGSFDPPTISHMQVSRTMTLAVTQS